MIDQLSEERIALLHPKIREDVLRMYREEVAPALTNGFIAALQAPLEPSKNKTSFTSEAEKNSLICTAPV